MKFLPGLVLGLLATLDVSAAQRLMLDAPKSCIEIDVRATGGSFTARLTDFQSEIVYEPGEDRIVRASLDFAFGAVRTGKDDRDRRMHEWQETARFPETHYRLLSIEPLSEGKHQTRGVLTLHGISREVTFPVILVADNVHLGIDGEADLDTRDFGLKVIRMFALLRVDPHVRVRFHLQGRLDAETQNREAGR